MNQTIDVCPFFCTVSRSYSLFFGPDSTFIAFDPEHTLNFTGSGTYLTNNLY